MCFFDQDYCPDRFIYFLFKMVVIRLGMLQRHIVGGQGQSLL